MLFPSYLVVLVGSCHVVLVLTCLGYGILAGISVLMVCLPDLWNPVIINALRRYVGFWGILKVQLWSFLMALLKLRHCTEVFTMRFPPWSLPRVGYGSGKRQSVLLVISWMKVVTRVKKGLALPGRHVQGASSHDFPDPGHPTPEEMEKIAPPLPPKEREVRWGVPRNLFPRLGVG